MKSKSKLYYSSILLSIASVLHAQHWGPNGPVYAIEIHSGDVYAGGQFFDVGGDPDADFLARWDGCNWHAVAPGLNGPVHDIVVVDHDVYVGGRFSQPYSNIARWDGSNWNPVGSGFSESVYTLMAMDSTLFAGGGKLGESGFVVSWNGTDWIPIGPPLNSVVVDLAIYKDVLYMTGDFTDAGGNPDADGIAMYVGEEWQNLGTGLHGSIWTSPGIDLLVHEDFLYVAGEFSSADGNEGVKNIAKWDGTSWSGLGQGPPYHFHLGMYDMTVFQDQLYVTAGSGYSEELDGIHRWNFDTQEWDIFAHFHKGADAGLTSLASDEENLWAGSSYAIYRWGPPPNPEDCTPTSITPISGELNVWAFPNPVSDRVILAYDVRDFNSGSLEVFDGKGALVIFIPELRDEIDLSALPSANYTIRIRIDDHVQKIRVVKQ